jgi:linoleoyl-CoA desaturase
MDKWDAQTQESIKNDFEALKNELMVEHRTAECQRLDNAYASRQYKKYKDEENFGRDLLKYGFDPVTFLYGSFLLGRSRFALFSLGHEVLHGTFRTHEDKRFKGKDWTHTLFINSKHWKGGHNQGHHKTPGVFGLDPESSPANYRGSTDFYAERGDRITALFTSYILNFHTLYFIGIVDALNAAKTNKNAWKELGLTTLALMKKEYIEYPLKAWVNAPRVILGNFLSFFFAEIISGFLGRTTHVRDDTVCLHINEFDSSNKAHYYITSLLNAGNINVNNSENYFGWDTHIEHHLFPFLSTRMLPTASARVKAICKKYDLPYHEGRLKEVIKVAYILDFKKLFSA